MMTRLQLEPNTTLFPVPVVLLTCGKDQPNVMTLNRISSCNAEPPMLAVSIRPARYSHDLVHQYGEFVINIPPQRMEPLTDFVGVTTGRKEDKWQAYRLTPVPAQIVSPPLIAECPVNLECRVVETLKLPSHTVFIGQVVVLHALEEVLNERGEVDVNRFEGMRYGAGVVRERPVTNVNIAELRDQLKR